MWTFSYIRFITGLYITGKRIDSLNTCSSDNWIFLPLIQQQSDDDTFESSGGYECEKWRHFLKENIYYWILFLQKQT